MVRRVVHLLKVEDVLAEAAVETTETEQTV
jgi:hypothetical protein